MAGAIGIQGFFVLTDEEVSLTNLVQHKMDTTDARPIKMLPHRLPMPHQAAADGTIEELQRAGIIEALREPMGFGGCDGQKEELED